MTLPEIVPGLIPPSFPNSLASNSSELLLSSQNSLSNLDSSSVTNEPAVTQLSSLQLDSLNVSQFLPSNDFVAGTSSAASPYTTNSNNVLTVGIGNDPIPLAQQYPVSTLSALVAPTAVTAAQMTNFRPAPILPHKAFGFYGHTLTNNGGFLDTRADINFSKIDFYKKLIYRGDIMTPSNLYRYLEPGYDVNNWNEIVVNSTGGNPLRADKYNILQLNFSAKYSQPKDSNSSYYSDRGLYTWRNVPNVAAFKRGGDGAEGLSVAKANIDTMLQSVESQANLIDAIVLGEEEGGDLYDWAYLSELYRHIKSQERYKHIEVYQWPTDTVGAAMGEGQVVGREVAPDGTRTYATGTVRSPFYST